MTETLQNKIDKYSMPITDDMGISVECLTKQNIDKAIRELREEIERLPIHHSCECIDRHAVLALIGESKK